MKFKQMLPVAILALSFLLPLSLSQCTDGCMSESGTLDLGITFNAPGSTSVTIQWLAQSNVISYEVFYRRFDSVSEPFIQANETMSTAANITGLDPQTQYIVRVCLFNTTECCSRCITTTHLSEPPSPPVLLRAVSTGPQIIEVEWTVPTITNGVIDLYIITYSSNTTSRNRTIINVGTVISTITDVMPGTVYTVIVRAMNEFGLSESSNERIVTTQTFSVDPGLLLYGDQSGFRFFKINEQNDQDPGAIAATDSSIVPGINIRDIDYHYERREIYVTSDDNGGSIVKYDVDISLIEADNFLNLTLLSTNNIYVNLSTDIDGISVDWVNNILYWSIVTGTTSQIYTGPLMGGIPQVVGAVINGQVNSLTVDPIHGYLYYVKVNDSLVRIPLSVVRASYGQSDFDITNREEVLLSSPAVSAFTLDLADSIYFIANGTRAIQRGLSGDFINTGSFVDVPFTYSILTSYSTVTYTNFVSPADMMVFVITAESGGGIVVLPRSNAITAMTMLRMSYQPIPAPPSSPTDVRVFSNDTSAQISWNVPMYSSRNFGADAHNDWLYLLNITNPSYTVNTSDSNITLTDLNPSTIYEFSLTAIGPGGSVSIDGTFVFRTLPNSNNIELLIAGDQGLIRTSYFNGIPSYIAREDTDNAEDGVYNQFLDVYYYITSSGINQYNESSQISLSLSDPSALELDWIARRLYWIESDTVYSVSTIDFSSLSQPQSFITQSPDISDIAIDPVNGILFWIVDSTIKGKTLNDLSTFDCISLGTATPQAITVNQLNSTLYYIIITSSIVTIGQIKFNNHQCIESTSMMRNITEVTLTDTAPVYMAYGANMLFITQESSSDKTVYSVPVIDTATTGTVAVNTIMANPSQFPSGEFRSISVISQDTQPLPVGLTPLTTGNVDILTPSPPGLPVLNNDTSNDSFIEITWAPSPFNISSVVYILEANFTLLNGTRRTIITDVLFTNSHQISGVPFSTTVDAAVTAYSNWYGAPPVKNTFRSPPALPKQVQNVRVIPYYPLRDTRSIVSALVVWDGLSDLEAGGMINDYFVNITFASNGALLDVANLLPGLPRNSFNGPPFSTGIKTEFSLTVFGVGNRQFYILDPDTSYNIQVFASNSAGNGPPSEIVQFSTNAAPPLEVVSYSPAGASVSGDLRNISLGVDTELMTLDALRRTVYYYNLQGHSIDTRSLDINGINQLLVKLPNGFLPLAMAYDWIAQTVYILGNTTSSQLQLWSVFRLNPKSLQLQFSTSSYSGSFESSMAADPFNGYLYWTENDGPSSKLILYNIIMGTTQTVISTSNKRDTHSSLRPTGTLAVDHSTEKVWFCDKSGDIISCNMTSLGDPECEMEVNKNVLMTSSGSDNNTNLVEAGLPCDSLSLDEERVYWTNRGSSLLYYINRTDPMTLLTFPLQSSNTRIITVNPDSQPFPRAAIMNRTPVEGINCLSPDYEIMANRPVVNVVNRTNTTAFITWTVNSTVLNSICAGEVVSILPSTYIISLELRETMGLVRLIDNIFNTEHTLTNLVPFTGYQLKIAAENEFTLVSALNGADFGKEITFTTLEGTPDPVKGLGGIAFGPFHVHLNWVRLTQQELKGPIDNLTFAVYQNDAVLTNTFFNNFTIDGRGSTFTLINDTTYTFGVSASNGVLSSDISTFEVTTPSLPPSLVKASQTSTSIDATLTITQRHSRILNITVYLLVVETYQRISPTDNANVNVSSHPAGTVLLYNFTGLKPNTQYQLMTEGDYEPAILNGNKFQAINISNPGSVIRTDAGVPDRPRNLMVMNDELSWTRPNDNGRAILRYTLRYSGVDDVDEPMPRTIDDGSVETYDLNQLGLAVDSTYNLSLVAVNVVGESDESDVIMYIVPLPWYQTLPFIVSVSVGGFLIILIFIILFILCCCFCCRSLSAKGQARFGPDYELSRLRALHSHHSAANPNYSWKSRDDYNCTDEDLDLLTKFPRNKLRLENFIDRGEFGEVYQGTALDILGPSTGPTPVAVKTMRKGQSPEEQRKFLSEAALMSNFNHLNIVKVLGVCIDNDPIYIIMELMPGGDLLKFLREARRDNGPALLTLQELVQISLDVAQGCRYLEQQHFIHRDIAARNCLVSSKGADRIVKIGDFGLAKDLYSTDYYQVEGQRRLPVRWMAPEALLQGKFTIESDIWSYGVLLWEIMTLGNQPYPGRTNQEVLQFVTGGGRLERPDNCPSRLYKVMQCCWKKYASERPHFTQIVEFVSNFLDHVNNKRDSYCSDDEEEDIEEALQRRPSRPSRSSSARSFGLLNLARQGSMRIRNSLRRRSSLHRKEELDSHANDQNHTGMNSEEDLINDDQFRERGPF